MEDETFSVMLNFSLRCNVPFPLFLQEKGWRVHNGFAACVGSTVLSPHTSMDAKPYMNTMVTFVSALSWQEWNGSLESSSIYV